MFVNAKLNMILKKTSHYLCLMMGRKKWKAAYTNQNSGRKKGETQILQKQEVQINHITKELLEVVALKALNIEARLDSIAAAGCSLYLHQQT